MFPESVHALVACEDPVAQKLRTEECLADCDYLIDRQFKYHENRIKFKRRAAPRRKRERREGESKRAYREYCEQFASDFQDAIADDLLDFRIALVEGLLVGFDRLRDRINERGEPWPENLEAYLESCISEFASEQRNRDGTTIYPKHKGYAPLYRRATPQYIDDNGSDGEDDFDQWPHKHRPVRTSGEIEQREAVRHSPLHRECERIVIADDDRPILEALATHTIKEVAAMFAMTTWQVRNVRERYRPPVPPA